MMKPQKYHILFFVFALLSVLASRADTVTVTFIEISNSQVGPDNEETSHGHRVPPHPIICTIDFSTEEISYSQDVQNIESYEVWDENQTQLLYTSDDESGFIRFLSEIDKPIRLIIRTPDYCLIAFFVV